MAWTIRLTRSGFFPAAIVLGACLLFPGIAGATDRAAMIERGRSAGERGDDAEALKAWERLAARNDRRAMTGVGAIYQTGAGVPADNEKALG